MRKIIICALLSLFVSIANATTGTVTIAPTSDGEVFPGDNGLAYPCKCSVQDGYYVDVTNDRYGDIKFSTNSFSEVVTRAILTINAYALPLFLTDLDVYGFTTTNGQLDATDADVGTFIREITIPTGTVYGQDISIDVTSFVASVDAPYVGFTLRDANGTIGIDSFSSLEFNYGHPAQLIVTTVPESEPYVMLATGLGLLGWIKRRKEITVS